MVQGILVRHWIQWNVKENELHKKMTRSFMVMQEAYRSGFRRQSLKCLSWASLLFLQASIRLMFPPRGLAFTGDFYVTATVLIYIYDFHIPSKL